MTDAIVIALAVLDVLLLAGLITQRLIIDELRQRLDATTAENAVLRDELEDLDDDG